MEMEKEARKLQDDLAFTDMLMAPSRGGDFVEMAIKKLQRLVVRMEADHHARAHVHIDYGRERHAASFAVDNGERLVGRMPTKYGRDVQTWIIQNQSRLQALTPRSGEYSRLKGCPVSLDHYRVILWGGRSGRLLWIKPHMSISAHRNRLPLLPFDVCLFRHPPNPINS